MSTAVCTLFEGDYHYGVAVLVNSLYRGGFRGVVWAGYRGALPPWARPTAEGPSWRQLRVADHCVVRFLSLETVDQLAFHKPRFMLHLWEVCCPEAEALFYFDPDIVNKASWEFYENWVRRGVALCEDRYGRMPSNHPTRLAWLEFARSHGQPPRRELDAYYNAGFIGLPRTEVAFLKIWHELQEACREAGHANLGAFYAHLEGERTPGIIEGLKPPLYIISDQEILNMTAMVSPSPLTTVGGDGRDFGLPGPIMSHAAGAHVAKPWRKQMLGQAIRGVPPSLADKLYWRHTHAPIPVYSRARRLWKVLDLRCAAVVGRFIRRAPAVAA